MGAEVRKGLKIAPDRRANIFFKLRLAAFCYLGVVCHAAASPEWEPGFAPLTLSELTDAPGMESNAHPSLVIPGTAGGGTTDLFSFLYHTFRRDLFNLGSVKELVALSWAPGVFDPAEYRKLALGSAGGGGGGGGFGGGFVGGGVKNFSMDATSDYINYVGRFIPNLRAMNRRALGIVMLREPVSRTRFLFNHWYIEGLSPFPRDWDLNRAAGWEMDLYESPRGAELLIRLQGADDGDWRRQLEAHEKLAGLFAAAAAEEGFPRGTPVVLTGIYSQNVVAMARLAFARGRMLVLQSEDYFSRVEDFCRTIIGPFVLGRNRPDLFAAEWRIEAERGSRYAPASELAPATACRLQKFFEPFNERLRRALAGADIAPVAFVTPPVEDEAWWWRNVSYCGQERR